MQKTLITLAAIAAVFGPLGATRAATVMIGASRDATIFKNNVNNGSGGGNGLFVGTNGADNSPRRSLIAFDVAGSIPSGALVDNVQLFLHLGQFPNVGAVATSTIGLHRLSANWGEGTTQQQIPPNDTFGGLGQGAAASDGDVTWNARFFSATTPTLWTTPGGDFDAAISTSAVVTRILTSAYMWDSTPALVNDVKSWIDNPSSNFGWMMVNADEVSPATFRGFYSRQTATVSFRPQLSVTYLMAGDFDGNDVVDSLDLANWKANFGMSGSATHAQGDANADGNVDGADYLVWQRQLGIGAMASMGAVPEPTAVMLVSMAALCLGGAARRHHIGRLRISLRSSDISEM